MSITERELTPAEKKQLKKYEKEISKKDVPKYHGAFICNSISGIQFVTKIGRYILNHDVSLERIFSEYVYE